MGIKLNDSIIESFEKLGYSTSGVLLSKKLTFKDLVKSIDKFFYYVTEFISEKSIYLFLDILSDILDIERLILYRLISLKVIGDL